MKIFTYPVEQYTRDLSIIPNYIEDNAFFLSRMRNIPLDTARAFIRKNMEATGKAPLRDPRILMLQRDKKTGDRAEAETTLTQYVDTVVKHELIMVPTMTVYLNPHQKKSHNANYIATNVAKRKMYKKLMFTAKMTGDKVLKSYYDILQNSCKIKNNSLSGAHASPSTPLQNKSTHSTLTSLCRISTSYANASNESLLAGNRHYWCPQVALSHLITTARHCNREAISLAMEKYNLHYPSVHEVMECVIYSTSNYWTSDVMLAEMERFVEGLTPTERAAIVYTDDMYHLSKHNSEFVKDFLLDLSTKQTPGVISQDAETAMEDSDLAVLAALVCSEEVAGRELSVIKATDSECYSLIANTALNSYNATVKHVEFIHAFWRGRLLAPSIAELPTIIRKAVVTSDTDSSIFTSQYWTMLYNNSPDLFSKRAYSIGYACTYLVSNIVRHRLALMSANVGAVREHIHGISMKNEYYFPIFVLTPAAKHYFALRSAQEGNILPVVETEIKGVHLRDSSAPPEVTRLLKSYVVGLMEKIISNGQLSIHDIFGPVAALEKDIINDLMNSGFKYLKSTQVKDPDSYAQGVDAPNYKRYVFWQDIFAPKYGDAPNPPYQAVKVSVGLDTRTAFTRWLADIKDKELAARISTWYEANDRKGIMTFVVPLSIILHRGMPQEILDAMHIRKLVKNIVSPFYLVMESMGVYMENKHISRLISDEYIPPEMA